MLHQRSIQYLLLLLSLLLLLGAGVLVRPFCLDVAYYGVTLDGVNVAGLGRQDVRQLLTLWQGSRRQVERKAYYGDQCFIFLDETLEYSLDVDETVKEVFSPLQRKLWPEKMVNMLQIWRQGYAVPVRFRYNDNRLNELVHLWQEKIDRMPRDASYNWEQQTWQNEELGRRLDVVQVKKLLLDKLNRIDEEDLVLPVVSEQPRITVDKVKQLGLTMPLGRFLTNFDDSEVNRSANIRLAAHKINGQILYPGEVFSFNQIVGPRDLEHGFREALEIVGNELVPGVGGGICQVSSTLYNAVLLANLSIKERYNHSKPLSYVPLGRDATVAYGLLDFQFVNSMAQPILILAEIQGSQLSVGLMGLHKNEAAVEVITETQKVLAPPIVRKQDTTIWLGETQLERQGKPGYEVTTVRVVREGQQEIKREVLAVDRYLPEPTVMKFGTKLPPFVEPFGKEDP